MLAPSVSWHTVVGMMQHDDIWKILEGIPDPEIPVVSIAELGMIRGIDFDDTGTEAISITLSPTYSGCPATDTIISDIKNTLFDKGFKNTTVKIQLSPAWTTDWISASAISKLRAYGIAPPLPRGESQPECPQCNSTNTQLVSQFGSTPCKSLHCCMSCLEPFDYFKCH